MKCKKVNYTLLANRIVREVTKYGTPYRFRKIVHDIEQKLDIRVDLGMLKQNLGDYIDERHILVGDVMVVEDWVKPV
jgi:hypothetical protein